MTLDPGPAVVRVPATSANLGPGFDSLGLALDLYDGYRAAVVTRGLSVEVTGEAADEVPRDERHLVVRAMHAAFERLGVEPPGLELVCHNVIPHGRGLGSSAAAIVGGVFLARALVTDGARRLPDEAGFRLAAELEGHPDNVAPAVRGGLTIAGRDRHGFFGVRVPVSPAVRATAFVPPSPLSTEVARGLLPATVSHADASANAGRTAMLVAALAGRTELLVTATEDFLHQSYRRPAMPESLDLVDRLRGDGHAAVVSGAGPTVLVLSAADADLTSCTPEGWAHLPLAVAAEGVRTFPPGGE